MRDPARIAKIIGLLHKYWGQNPDLRLGQIVSNLTPKNYAHTFTHDPGTKYEYVEKFPDPYHVEDTEWEEILRAALKEPA